MIFQRFSGAICKNQTHVFTVTALKNYLIRSYYCDEDNDEPPFSRKMKIKH